MESSLNHRKLSLNHHQISILYMYVALNFFCTYFSSPISWLANFCTSDTSKSGITHNSYSKCTRAIWSSLENFSPYSRVYLKIKILIYFLVSSGKQIELHRDKTNKMACAPSEDSDQPGHLPSLIRVFAVRLKKARSLSYPWSAQRRLWSDWTDAQADLSLRWAHMPFCWFCHLSRCGSIMLYWPLVKEWVITATKSFIPLWIHWKTVSYVFDNTWSRAQTRAFWQEEVQRYLGRSFGPKFRFPYRWYIFQLLLLLKIGSSKWASFARLFLPNCPLDWVLLDPSVIRL